MMITPPFYMGLPPGGYNHSVYSIIAVEMAKE